MKKLFVTLVLIALAIGLSAQTGLFNISFGQKQAALEKLLKGQGFSIGAGEMNGRLIATNSNIKGLLRIEINLGSEGIVNSWFIYYNIKDNAALYDEVENQLLELHGTSRVWDDYFGQWMWELDNEMGAYLSEDGETLWAAYYDFDYSVYDDMW